MKPKHEIKIDVTPVVETGEKIANHAQAAAERGMGFFRDMTERMAPAPKWVSEDNPYRKAFLEAMEAIENMERQAEDDAKALGPAKPPARIHQEGRAHGLRDGRSILQRFFPPEVAGKIKPGK